MYTLLKPIQVRQKLLDKGVKIFTPLDFMRIFSLDEVRTKRFLEKQSKAGLLQRLKKGLYTLKTDTPSDEEVANLLYKPSYVSFEYALSKFGIIPEATYAITNATTKATREFDIENKKFLYLTIKIKAYTGYELVGDCEKKYLIAEPEKALVDYLYFVSLGQKSLNDRLLLTGLSKDKIKKYSSLFERKSLDNLVKHILE